MTARILALGAFVASAAAAAISARAPADIEARQSMGFDIVCDGNLSPNWDDCEYSFLLGQSH